MVSFACAPLIPSHLYSITCRFLGSSTRTSVVGAIPPSHCLVLGSCSRSLNDGNSAQRMMLMRLFTYVPLAVVNELRCNAIHSRGIMFNSHKKPLPPPPPPRPAFSAVVVERLHIKEIGEFVSATLSLEDLPSLSHSMQVLYEDGRARAFFGDCTICELSHGCGIHVTDAGGIVHSLTSR
jgi:hypothetical protein